MDNQEIKTEELLDKVNNVIKKYDIGTVIEKKPPIIALQENIIPAMEQSKNTLGGLYKYSPNDKSGFIGKIKNLILGKLKNITINVVERQSMRQQKQNDLTYQAIQNLTAELQELKEKISKNS